jgi:hypothetical protein
MPQVSFPTMELPITLMEALIYQASKHTKIDTSPPPPPAPPSPPQKPLHASSLKKAKRLAAAQASSTQKQKPYTPDAITAASLPSPDDEAPATSITELITSTTVLSDRICDTLISDATRKLHMRGFEERYVEYKEMIDSMKAVLSHMAEKGLHEKSFLGKLGGDRFKVGAKIAKALDGQRVVWEEGEEEWEEMIGGMMGDWEIIRQVVDEGAEIEIFDYEGEEQGFGWF